MVTPELFYNNYEFKMLNRELKRKLPFIKKITTNTEYLNDFSHTYFVIIHMDPYEVLEILKPEGDVKVQIFSNEISYTKQRPTTMGSIFTPSEFGGLLDKELTQMGRKILNNGLPEHLKLSFLMGSKKFNIGGMISTSPSK